MPMPGGVARRTFLGGAAAGLTLAGAAPAFAAPQITSYALAPTWVGVLVTGLPAAGVARLFTPGGQQMASGTITGGRVLLRVSIPAGWDQVCRFVAPGWATTLRVSTAVASLNGSLWRLVNKRNALAATYVPPGLTWVDGAQLRSQAASGYVSLRTAARAAGLGMAIASGYRSYATQAATYRYWVSRLGQAGADEVSARPGHSEHQTGLAIDVKRPDGYCTLSTCFGTTALGRWLVGHAANHGFIIRYEYGQRSVVGYAYEPWHLRYLGVPAARDYAARRAHAYETYLGMPAAPSY